MSLATTGLAVSRQPPANPRRRERSPIDVSAEVDGRTFIQLEREHRDRVATK